MGIKKYLSSFDQRIMYVSEPCDAIMFDFDYEAKDTAYALFAQCGILRTEQCGSKFVLYKEVANMDKVIQKDLF